jgi:hypothetical protein
LTQPIDELIVRRIYSGTSYLGKVVYFVIVHRAGYLLSYLTQLLKHVMQLVNLRRQAHLHPVQFTAQDIDGFSENLVYIGANWLDSCLLVFLTLQVADSHADTLQKGDHSGLITQNRLA